jgi:hypothetical protein
VLGFCLAEDPEGLLVVCLEVRLPHFPVQDPPELGVAQLTASVVVLVQDVVHLRKVQGSSFDSYSELQYEYVVCEVNCVLHKIPGFFLCS